MGHYRSPDGGHEVWSAYHTDEELEARHKAFEARHAAELPAKIERGRELAEVLVRAAAFDSAGAARAGRGAGRREITRIDKIAWIALLVATQIHAGWLFLRPAPVPRVSMLSSIRGVICTPSRLRGCGPEPVYPPEFELMPLHLPPQSNRIAGPGEALK